MRYKSQVNPSEVVCHRGIAESRSFSCVIMLLIAMTGCREQSDTSTDSQSTESQSQVPEEFDEGSFGEGSFVEGSFVEGSFDEGSFDEGTPGFGNPDMFNLVFGDDSVQTCQRCWSTRYRKSNEVIYESPDYATCQHVWQWGVSNGVNEPFKDGTLVLIYQDGIYGAFLPLSQEADEVGFSEDSRITRVTKQTLKYKWYYRTDGLGRFDTDDKAVLSGKGSGSDITFGPYAVSWGSFRLGHGCIYYSLPAGGVAGEGDHWLCVTNLKDISGVDAADPKWVYKSFLGDPGRTSAEFAEGRSDATSIRE